MESNSTLSWRSTFFTNHGAQRAILQKRVWMTCRGFKLVRAAGANTHLHRSWLDVCKFCRQSPYYEGTIPLQIIRENVFNKVLHTCFKCYIIETFSAIKSMLCNANHCYLHEIKIHKIKKCTLDETSIKSI